MVGIAIVICVLAALLIFSALNPRLLLDLDEGWKFGVETESLDAFIGTSTVGRLLAGIAAFVVGLIALVYAIGHSHIDTSPTSVPPPYSIWPTAHPMLLSAASPSPPPRQQRGRREAPRSGDQVVLLNWITPETNESARKELQRSAAHAQAAQYPAHTAAHYGALPPMHPAAGWRSRRARTAAAPNRTVT